MISISETKDHRIIAGLNCEVQNIHAKLHPELFKSFNQTAMEQALENYLANPIWHCFIAKKGNVVIGYVLCFIRETGENAFRYAHKTIYIDQLSVLKAYQRSGAGKLLLEEVEKLAGKNSITRIELDDWSSNVVASEYFRKHGFTLYKERLFKPV